MHSAEDRGTVIEALAFGPRMWMQEHDKEAGKKLAEEERNKKLQQVSETLTDLTGAFA